MRTTSPPPAVTPAANACARPGEVSRMSCPTTAVPPPARTTSANASPKAAATRWVSWLPTRPRTSLALTMARRSITETRLGHESGDQGATPPRAVGSAAGAVQDAAHGQHRARVLPGAVLAAVARGELHRRPV